MQGERGGRGEASAAQAMLTAAVASLEAYVAVRNNPANNRQVRLLAGHPH